MISVVESIRTGEMDKVLDQISDAIRLRKQFLTLSLTVGDEVRLLDVSPRYLSGQLAVVTGFKTSRIVVELKNPPVNSKWERSIRVPRTCVEKVQRT